MLRFLLLNLIAASLMFGLAKSFRGSYSGRSSRIGSIVLRPRSLLLRRDLTVNVLVVGKKNSVERWIQDGVSEFEKRLVPVMNLNTQFLKSNDALLDAVKKSKGCSMAMDERGTCWLHKYVVLTLWDERSLSWGGDRTMKIPWHMILYDIVCVIPKPVYSKQSLYSISIVFSSLCR